MKTTLFAFTSLGLAALARAEGCPAVPPTRTTIIYPASATTAATSTSSTSSSAAPTVASTSEEAAAAAAVPSTSSSVPAMTYYTSSSPTTLVTVVVSSTPTTLSTSTTPVASTSTSSTSSAAAASTSAVSSTTTSASSSTDSSSGSTVSGEATYYGGNTSGGTCSFSTYTLPSSLFGTAYSGAVWDSAAACGRCVAVTGPSGNTITAMVVDECPECADGHLDLFEDAFAELADTSLGVISISYTFVECGITTPLVLHNKSGTSQYWFSMQVVNANEGVSTLEVSTDSGATWQATTRQDYNFFEYASGFGTDTVDVRVTSVSGAMIEVSSVSVASDSQTTADANF